MDLAKQLNLTVLALWMAGIGSILSADESRPNFLILFVDDLRPMANSYGHAHMVTPNLDRLSAEGIRFERAYCQVPTCGASRASLFTSVYPTIERFPNFLTWAEKDAPNKPTLPQRFKEAGYMTLSNGKVFHHPTDTQNRSWSEPAWRPVDLKMATFHNEETQEYMSTSTVRKRKPNGELGGKKVPMFEESDVLPEETWDGQTVAKTLSDLERLAETGQPFFLACGLYRPHMPFYAPLEAWEPYPLESILTSEHRHTPAPFPAGMRLVKEQGAYLHITPEFEPLTYNSEAFHQHMRRGYYSSVTHSDLLVGRVLDRLDELGLAENTYVLLLGDHGFLLGEHNQWAKNVLLHNALRTSLWMKGPGLAEGGVVNSHVEFVDIYPTLLSLAGIDFEQDCIDGMGFQHLLTNPELKHRDSAYTRFEKGDALTTENYFYVLVQDEGEERALLIDRSKDPHHRNNISGEPEYAAVEAALRERVLERITLAND